MNCTRCGNPIPEGSAFCTACGTPVQAPQPQQYVQQPQYAAPQPQYAAPQPQQPYGYDAYGNPVQAPYGYAPAPAPAPAKPGPFANLFPAIKGLLSKDIVKNVGASLKSGGLEWIIFGGASVLIFALALIANIGSSIGQIVPGFNSYPAVVKSQITGMIPYILIFFLYFLLGTVAYGLTALGVFLVGGKVCENKPSFMGALNMVGHATVPLTAVYTLNLIIGLIYYPLCILLSVTALILTLVLIYGALEKNAAEGKSAFIAFAIVAATVTVVTLALGLIFGKIVIENGVSSVVGSAMSSLF